MDGAVGAVAQQPPRGTHDAGPGRLPLGPHRVGHLRAGSAPNNGGDHTSHCLAGNSLLLTGLPGTGNTYLARTIVARLREQGEAVHLSKTHCSAQNLGLRRRPTTGCAGMCAGAARKSWTGWWWRRSRSWTWRSGPAWGREVPAAGRLPAVAGRADSWAGRPISSPLEHSQLIRDHELTENMRSDPGIFNFVKWLRVGEEACPTLEQAKAEAEGALPLQARVAGHHAGHQPQQAHGCERSGEPRPGAGGLKALGAGDAGHPHRFGML